MAKVYQCINNVQSALSKCGISKDSVNQQQNFKFRSVDAIYNTLAPLLASNGLCMLPRVLKREMREHTTAKGTVLFYCVVEVEYALVCAEDNSQHIISIYGEAMDTGDKATNKAMSAAFKYACIQTFCIPTEGDNDADGVTHTEIVKDDSQERFRIYCKNTGITKEIADNWLIKYGVEKLSQLNKTQIDEIMGSKNG